MTVFQAITVLVVILQMIKYWYVKETAKHPEKIEYVYKLNILVFIGYAIVETTVGLSNPAQMSVLLFNIVNVWSIIMNTKGLLILKENKKAELENIEKKPKRIGFE